jgi:hypothetical protein
MRLSAGDEAPSDHHDAKQGQKGKDDAEDEIPSAVYRLAAVSKLFESTLMRFINGYSTYKRLAGNPG